MSQFHIADQTAELTLCVQLTLSRLRLGIKWGEGIMNIWFTWWWLSLLSLNELSPMFETINYGVPTKQSF